jgi:hypothetical protein
LGTPRGRYDEHSSKSSLSCETKIIEPVGERTTLPKVDAPSFATLQQWRQINAGVMRYGFDSFSPPSWEPQEEGMMNIEARFSLSKKPRFIDPKRKKPI